MRQTRPDTGRSDKHLYGNSLVIRRVNTRRPLFGPYSAPEVEIGDELLCSVHGLQVVAGFYGPRQWPRAKTKGGRARLIVCGDLCKAISQETLDTVALQWGVHKRTVANWRKRLGLVGVLSPANHAFKAALMSEYRADNPRSFVDPGRQYLKTLNRQQRRALGVKTAGASCWLPSDINVLTEYANVDATRLLNRSIKSIATARRRYGIPHPTKAHVCRFCGYEWKSYSSKYPDCCANRLCRRKHWRSEDHSFICKFETVV